MKPKILTIQFRKNTLSAQKEGESICREIGDQAEVEFLSALDKTIDWNFPETIMEEYSGVIFGGSGDFDFDGARDENDEARKISYEILGQLRPLFTYLFDNDIPTLGICYGHQLIGAFAGAQVTCDQTQRKTASHEVKLLVDRQDYFLFADLPDSFGAQYAHKDALDRIPAGAVLVMNGGERCKISALKYKNNIYTTQFHPELSYEDMLERANRIPEYLPEGAIIEELFEDTPHANTILQNFGKFVALQAEAGQQVVVV